MDKSIPKRQLRAKPQCLTRRNHSGIDPDSQRLWWQKASANPIGESIDTPLPARYACQAQLMDIVRGYEALSRPLRSPVVAIGNFDGVHRGHAHIFATARAHAHGGELVMLTFDPHPAKVLAPTLAPPLITPLSRKLELCADAARRMGVTSVHPVVCDLTDVKAPLAPAYDRILLDAPCSGLGVLRRHPEAKWRRQPTDAAPLAPSPPAALEGVRPGRGPGRASEGLARQRVRAGLDEPRSHRFGHPPG